MPEPSSAATSHRGGGHPQHPHRGGAALERLSRPKGLPAARTAAHGRIGPNCTPAPRIRPRARRGQPRYAARRQRRAKPLPMHPNRSGTLARASCPPSATPKLYGKDRTTTRNQEPRDSCNNQASYCGSQGVGLLGEDLLTLTDDNEDQHCFFFETFFERYDALTLGAYLRPEVRFVAAPT